MDTPLLGMEEWLCDRIVWSCFFWWFEVIYIYGNLFQFCWKILLCCFVGVELVEQVPPCCLWWALKVVKTKSYRYPERSSNSPRCSMGLFGSNLVTLRCYVFVWPEAVSHNMIVVRTHSLLKGATCKLYMAFCGTCTWSGKFTALFPKDQRMKAMLNLQVRPEVFARSRAFNPGRSKLQTLSFPFTILLSWRG